MKKVAIVLSLLAVIASHAGSAQGRSTALDFYLRVSTGMRLGSSEPKDYYYDWSLGLDLGVGLQHGRFHAGIGGGVRSQIVFLLAAIFSARESPEPMEAKEFGTKGSGTAASGGDMQVYFDFPVRCYFGFDLSEDIFLDGFGGRYYRVSSWKRPTSGRRQISCGSQSGSMLERRPKSLFSAHRR